MGKRKLFYDYRNNVDMTLPSSKRLYKRLGDYDTLAEYTMCALLDFEKYCDKKIPFADYVTLKAQEHQINLRGGVTLGDYKTALIKSFIVNSHAILSDFIRHYRDDIRNLFDRNFKLEENDKISELNRLLNALGSIGIKPLFPVWLLPVMDYYRTVRNSVAHNERDKNACKKAYSNINISAIDTDYWVFKGKVPNEADAITMDDFYFYSACVKHVANYLVMALKGRVVWSQIGYTHTDLDPENIEKGTNSVSLINRVFSQYSHQGTKEEIRSLLDVLKERKEEYRNKLYKTKIK